MMRELHFLFEDTHCHLTEIENSNVTDEEHNFMPLTQLLPSHVNLTIINKELQKNLLTKRLKELGKNNQLN